MTNGRTSQTFALALSALWLSAACASSSANQSGSRADTPPGPRAGVLEQPPRQADPLPKGSNTNADAKMVADFKARVDAYVKLRNEAGRGAPDLKKTEEPTQIAAAENILARHIRDARAGARRGDIFTPATEAMFRRLVRPAVTQGADGADNRAIIKDDAPQPAEVPFKVNAEYPKDAPLSTVPPDVLQSLPPLPEDLQYRFVGRHLILYDSKPNLIVDFMLNALP